MEQRTDVLAGLRAIPHCYYNPRGRKPLATATKKSRLGIRARREKKMATEGFCSDRGVVLDIQMGNDEGEEYVFLCYKLGVSYLHRRSVRVFHNGRRWYYQLQAILSERSGIIDSPAVRFLKKAVRYYGFNDKLQ